MILSIDYVQVIYTQEAGQLWGSISSKTSNKTVISIPNNEKMRPNAWLWEEGMTCAAYVINQVSLSSINVKSPYELMFEEKFSVKHFKVFGFICYVHVPDVEKN
jgi:hypothetical protein